MCVREVCLGCVLELLFCVCRVVVCLSSLCVGSGSHGFARDVSCPRLRFEPRTHYTQSTAVHCTVDFSLHGTGGCVTGCASCRDGK